jgi:hypothetical protein
MKRDDTVYLQHILDAIARLQAYLTGVSYDEFLQSHLLQDGVVRQLEIIGEAARNISDDFKAVHADFLGARWLASGIDSSMPTSRSTCRSFGTQRRQTCHPFASR